MWKVILYLVLATAAFVKVTDGPRLTIDARPHVLMAGADVIVKCDVYRDPGNRAITVRIDGYTLHEESIDGDRGPRTFAQTFHGIPCGTTTASCVLTSDHDQITAEQPLLVGGCQ